MDAIRICTIIMKNKKKPNMANGSRLLNVITTIVFAIILFNFLHQSTKFNFTLLADSFSIHGGSAYSLPPDVLHLYVLANNEKIKDFNLQGSLSNDPLLYQRATEFLYPIRMSTNSSNIFIFQSENSILNCLLKNKSGRIAHYACTNF